MPTSCIVSNEHYNKVPVVVCGATEMLVETSFEVADFGQQFVVANLLSPRLLVQCTGATSLTAVCALGEVKEQHVTNSSFVYNVPTDTIARGLSDTRMASDHRANILGNNAWLCTLRVFQACVASDTATVLARRQQDIPFWCVVSGSNNRHLAMAICSTIVPAMTLDEW